MVEQLQIDVCMELKSRIYTIVAKKEDLEKNKEMFRLTNSNMTHVLHF